MRDNLSARKHSRFKDGLLSALCTSRDSWKMVSFRYLIPSLLTVLALCSGVTAIYFSLRQQFEPAVTCIILAAFFDLIDGRMARLLQGTSHFGAELDSLADFVNFCVGPAILLYIWSLQSLTGFGWIAVMIFIISGALRIARHNVILVDNTKPDWSSHFFTGVPTPAGATIVLLPAYLSLLDIIDIGHDWDAPISLYLVFVSLLMVSRLPTFSGKQIGTTAYYGFYTTILGAALAIIALIVFPWLCLSAMSIGYLASLPFSFRAHRRLINS